MQRAVRHEADRRPGPQQLVDAARHLGLGRVDQHALFLRYGLAGEPAGDLQSVPGVEVEVDGSHFLPAWRIANRTSSGTGLAVDPFSRPPFQAVPAMSRGAQRILRVKRARKHAAVMAPPGRPPMLAKSAKFERSPSW